MATLEDDMLAEMRALLGPGYVPEWYIDNAAPFIQIAKYYIEMEIRKRRPRRRYKFLYRVGDTYYWESATHVDGSRVEQITCNVYWFWNSEAIGDRIENGQ